MGTILSDRSMLTKGDDAVMKIISDAIEAYARASLVSVMNDAIMD
jgi:hypothetical protein